MVAPSTAAAPAVREVYHPAFDTMARAVNLDANAALIDELKDKTGYDRRAPSVAYKPEVAQAVLELIARRCFADQPLSEAYRLFGQRAFSGYRATLIGQVILAAVSMMGVERAVRLALRGFQSSANFTRHEVLRPGERQLVYRAHDSIMPPQYVLGLFEELMKASHNRNVKVSIGSITDAHTDFNFTW